MPITYKALGTQTVGSGGAANITFSSIPATYTDLIIWLSGRSTRSNHLDDLYLRFNGNATGYTGKLLGSDGSGPLSVNYSTPGLIDAATATSNTFGCVTIYMPNYTVSQDKTFSSDTTSENNSASAFGIALQDGIWANNSVITSIALTLGAGNFVQYSTATLYGIKNS
jgi:hypothetical protein